MKLVSPNVLNYVKFGKQSVFSDAFQLLLVIVGVFHTVERIIKIILKIIYSFVIQYVDETANKLILSGVNTLKMSMLTDCSLKERRRATSAPTSQVPH